jgi:hypothetical protein
MCEFLVETYASYERGREEFQMRRLRGLTLGGRLVLALAVGGVVFGIASAVQASIPDAKGVIHGCYSTNGAKSTNGTQLNIIDSAVASCNGNNTSITWNQKGPTGAKGTTGARGPSGHSGPSGARGASGPSGARGASGPTGPSGGSALTGRIEGFPTVSHIVDSWGAPSGVSLAAGAEQDAETVSPNAALMAQDFWVQKTGLALPPGDSIAVWFSVGGVSQPVCTIFAQGTSCTGPAAPISVPAGSTISIRVTTNGSGNDIVLGYDLLFGWRATS